jgi:hypothetical protein
MTKACELVQGTFEVITKEDAALRLEETEFGYQSYHYVVRMPRAWLAVPSFNGFERFRAELQVRTLAQHIWASASHQLQYKHEESVPKPIKRTIHRASALLETVDLEFERVLQERVRYLEGVDVAAEISLNVDVLARVLTEQLPRENKGDDEPYADLLSDLTAFNVKTTTRLLDIIRKNLIGAIAEDKKRAEEIAKDAGRPVSERTKRGVFFTHVGLVRAMMRLEFGSVWSDYMIKRTSISRAKRASPKKPVGKKTASSPKAAVAQRKAGKPRRKD